MGESTKYKILHIEIKLHQYAHYRYRGLWGKGLIHRQQPIGMLDLITINDNLLYHMKIPIGESIIVWYDISV